MMWCGRKGRAEAWALLVAGGCVAAGCATAGSTGVATTAVSVPVVAAPAPARFQQVDARLYRGTRPDAEDLRVLAAQGVKTIVTLEGDPSSLAWERTMASADGMEVVSIPISLEREPTAEEALLFLGTVLAPERQPLYVHCADGCDRTGALVAFYRVVVGGWEIKAAYEEAKAFGFHPYYGDAALHRFIHQLKDHPEYFEWARELAAAPPDGEVH